MKVAIFRALRVGRQLKKHNLHLLFKEQLPWWARTLFTLLGPVDPKCKDRPRGEALRACIESLGPVVIKFGQLLSTRPDVMPADLAKELAKLQDQVAPFDPKEFMTLVEKSMPAPLTEIFSEISPEPLASASVAQVHRAKLLDGSDVVIKCLRPNLKPTIDKDVALMYFVAQLAMKYLPDAKRLRPVEVVDEYKLTIERELNLRIEAGNASLFRRNSLPQKLLYIPEVYFDLSSDTVMVSEYIDGIPVNDVEQLRAQNTNFKLLAERGVEIFFTQVFEQNFFHADMHPGNIFVSRKTPENPSYMAVDCAISGSLTQADQYYLARNLLAIFRRNYRQVAELHIASGWVPPTTRVGDFESAIRSVCEPIFEKPLGEISFANVLVSLFQTAREFEMQVQPQLVLLQKTLLNIEGLGRQLYPQLDIWATAHPFLERWLKNRFHPKTLWRSLKDEAPELLEKLPELPHLVYNALKNASSNEYSQPTPKTRKPSSLSGITWLGAAAVGVVVGMYIPSSDAALWVAGGLCIGYFLARTFKR